MAVPKKIIDYLKKEKIHYHTFEHDKAFTASQVASAQHVPGKQMIKTVIVKADNEFVMCLLSAVHNLDLNKFKSQIQAKEVRLAKEDEMKKLFPECELGSEPPLGTLYNLKVFADTFLEKDAEVAFNAGTHIDLITMKYEEFKRLVRPHMVEVGVHI